MSKFKSKIKILMFSLVILFLFGGIFLLTNKKEEEKLSKEEYILEVLETEEYSYLPEPAKNYIASVYEETGEVIKTEKNKEEGKPYLNPRYVEYLVSNNRSMVNSILTKEFSEKKLDNYDLIPRETIIDYYRGDIISANSSEELPSSYDLRNVDEKKYVTPIKNQNPFGLCWAFASNAQLESYLLKKNNQTYTSDATIFSERQMDYALSINGIKEFNNKKYGYRILGGGGNFRMVTDLAKEGLTFVTQEGWENIYINYFDRAYLYSDENEMELQDTLNRRNSLYEVNSTIEMPYLNVGNYDVESESYKALKKEYLTIVKNYIMQYGGAYVGTGAPEHGCSIYDSSLGNYIIYDNNKCELGSHAMQIIGWDDSIDYEFCAADGKTTIVHSTDLSNCSEDRKVSGKGVWILKNSWDVTSREYTSYTYLAYDSLYTDINMTTGLSLTKDKMWDYSEKIEGDYYGSVMNIDSKNHFNIFNYKNISNKKLKLDKIKIYISDINTTYNLFISKTGFIDNSDDFETFSNFRFKDSELVDTFKIEMPGLYTIDLSDKNIIVEEGYVWGLSSTKNLDVASPESIHYYSYLNDNVSVKTYDVSYKNTKETNIDDNYEVYVYSEVSNIPHDGIINYRLYDLHGNDISDKLSYKYNNVADNNVNSLLTISNTVEPGEYFLKTLYNNEEKCESKVYLSEIKLMTGTGTQSDPYIITTPDELYMINDDMDAYYELGNDIDLTFDTSKLGGKYYNEGKGWIPIGSKNEEVFNGSFDGKNHKIIGLTMKDSIYHGGLFYNISPNTSKKNIYIKNLILKDFDIESFYTYNNYITYVGALAGFVSNLNNYEKYISSDVSVEISNIAILDSKISGRGPSGSLVGRIDSFKENSININDIFSNSIIYNKKDFVYSSKGGIIGYSYSVNEYEENASVILNNIQNIGNLSLSGKIYENIDDIYYDYGGIIGHTKGKTILQNIINSSKFINNAENNKNIVNYGSIIGKNTYTDDEKYLKANGEVELTNIYYTQDADIIGSLNHKFTQSNVLKKDLFELKNDSLYSGWDSEFQKFNDNWKIETLDNIKRIPILKFVDFDYVKINEINNLYEESSINIYDYLNPNNSIIKDRTSFKIEDEKIATIDEKGNVRGLKVGDTILHIESEYDGYIKDVNLSVKTAKYTLTFNSNYGEEETYIQKFVDEEKELKVNQFQRIGYKFTGWNTSPDGGGTSYSNKQSIKINKNLTLYALWEPIVYKVKFVDDNKYTEQEFTYDKKQKLKTNLFEKTGYSFLEWILDGDSNTRYKDNEEVINLTSEEKTIILYASWTSNKYSIRFNSNGGAGSMSLQKISYDISLNLSQNLFTKDGYSFKEWNTKADGTGTVYKDKQQVKNLTSINDAIIDLYAIWEKIPGIYIEKYSVDQNNKFIKYVKNDTTIEQFKKNIITDGNYEVKIDYKTTDNKNYVYTGGKTKIYKDSELVYEYTNIVTGDISGDGLINSADLLRVRQHLLGIKKSINEYFVASDVNFDNEINSADLFRMRQHLLGIKEIG